MNEVKNLINIDDPKSMIAFLKEPLKMVEAVTGLLAASSDERKMVAGRLVQASIKYNLFTQLGRELEDLAKKGRIKEDYYSTHRRQVSLCELLKFIDEEVPDDERFKAMKSIFFTAISKYSTEADEILAYELMQIGKKLTSNDIMLLRAIYDIAKGGSTNLQEANTRTTAASEWLKIVAHKIGHKLTHLVELSEQRLIDFKIIPSKSATLS